MSPQLYSLLKESVYHSFNPQPSLLLSQFLATLGYERVWLHQAMKEGGGGGEGAATQATKEEKQRVRLHMHTVDSGYQAHFVM